MDKPALRQYIRTLKQQMTEAEIDQKSQLLCSMLLDSDLYRNAKSIYGYMNYNQEVRTQDLLKQAIRDGKRVAIPKCYGKEMRFIWIDDLSQTVKSSCGIPEPIHDTPVADDPTALVLLPGIAFDATGHRIGYGGGYYDKFLAVEPNHPSVALCYDFQLLKQLPTDEYDIPADLVLWV